MEAHNRDLYLYKRLNTRVLGVSMDDPVTLKFFAESLQLDFPLMSNVLGFVGKAYGAYRDKPPFGPDGSPNNFGRRTVVVDRLGIIRYLKDGSPDDQEILMFLLKLEEEFRGKK
jgi:peroxiredoxin